MVHIRRLEQRHDGFETLTVEMTDEDYRTDAVVQTPQGAWVPEPGRHDRLLRLVWTSWIFALKSYDEFYAGPFGTYHPSKQGVPQGWLYEIVNDPNPWIEEILEENNNTDTFPPYGVPVMVSERLRRLQGNVPVTGRFFPPTARLEDSGTHMDFFNSSGKPFTPQENAEIERHKSQKRDEMLGRPRYRHLFIASETHMLEVLCEDLPTWEWVEVRG